MKYTVDKLQNNKDKDKNIKMSSDKLQIQAINHGNYNLIANITLTNTECKKYIPWKYWKETTIKPRVSFNSEGKIKILTQG